MKALIAKLIVPLSLLMTIELVYLTALSLFMLQSDRISNELHEYKRVSIIAENLRMDFTGLATALIFYGISKSEESQKMYADAQQSCENRFAELKAAVANQPQKSAVIAKIEEQRIAIKRSTDKVESSIYEGKQKGFNLGMLSKHTEKLRLFKNSLVIAKMLAELGSSDEPKIKELSKEQSRLDSIISTMLLAGAVLNVILLIAALLLLKLGLGSTIGKLGEQARRWFRSEGPLEPLSGDDELSKLDQAFFSLARNSKGSLRGQGGSSGDLAESAAELSANLNTLKQVLERLTTHPKISLSAEGKAALESANKEL